VTIHDFNVFRSVCRPSKTYPILVVDSDAVLSPAVPLKNFKAIAWWRPEILDGGGAVQHDELALSLGGKCLDARTILPMPKPLWSASLMRLRRKCADDGTSMSFTIAPGTPVSSAPSRRS
jgi:hypothetical protein